MPGERQEGAQDGARHHGRERQRDDEFDKGDAPSKAAVHGHGSTVVKESAAQPPATGTATATVTTACPATGRSHHRLTVPSTAESAPSPGQRKTKRSGGLCPEFFEPCTGRLHRPRGLAPAHHHADRPDRGAEKRADACAEQQHGQQDFDQREPRAPRGDGATHAADDTAHRARRPTKNACAVPRARMTVIGWSRFGYSRRYRRSL